MDVVIRPLEKREAREAGQVVAESLLVEPGFAAIVPDESTRRKVLTPLLTGTVRNAIRHGSAYGAIGEGRILGVAVWLPPGAYPFDIVTNLRMLPSLRGTLHVGFAKARELAAMEGNAELHFPREPVWYLQALGVEPGTQGQGIGSKLLQPVLTLADAKRQACYLETGTVRNVRFYERFGFQIREAAARLAPTGPTHWTMLRRPR